jgi:hypothetical protein
MQIRRFWLVTIALLIPGSAGAHEHRMDLYGGFAIQSGSVLVGAHTALAVPLPKDQGEIRRVSVIVDTSLHGGSDDKRKSNILGGVRYTFARALEQKALPFVQVLFGAAESEERDVSDWDGAVAIGAGVERILWGTAESGWGVRGQADIIVSGDSGARVSFGFYKRWSATH